jgi:hypothetical protein
VPVQIHLRLLQIQRHPIRRDLQRLVNNREGVVITARAGSVFAFLPKTELGGAALDHRRPSNYTKYHHKASPLTAQLHALLSAEGWIICCRHATKTWRGMVFAVLILAAVLLVQGRPTHEGEGVGERPSFRTPKKGRFREYTGDCSTQPASALRWEQIAASNQRRADAWAVSDRHTVTKILPFR